MNEHPSVTVIIPVKNEEKHIAECLKSVFNQTLESFEIIVVDDGSEDKTKEVVALFNDERLLLVANPGMGKVSAFNFAYSIAKGENIVFLGGDDVLPKESLELRVKALADVTSRGVRACAFGQLTMISEDSRFNGIKKPKSGNRGCKSGGTLILNKKMADVVFPIPVQLPNEDTWTKICVQYFCEEVVDVPHVVLLYRIHGGNSHSRYMDFANINEFFHLRYLAYDFFSNRYKEELSDAAIREIQITSKAEELRYQGGSVRLLFLRGVPLMTKFSFFFNSSPLWYFLKMQLLRLRF